MLIQRIRAVQVKILLKLQKMVLEKNIIQWFKDVSFDRVLVLVTLLDGYFAVHLHLFCILKISQKRLTLIHEIYLHEHILLYFVFYVRNKRFIHVKVLI